MSLLNDIRNHLSADGVFDGVVWKCYIGFLPDAVGTGMDQVVGLFDTGGFPADTLNRENVLPTFQVTVRCGRLEYAACRAKWQQVYDSLQDAAQGGASPDHLAGYYLIQAMASSPLMWVDDTERICMSVNFRVLKSK